MRYPIYQVDAFTDQLFGGNPAAVMPLETELPDQTLQALAAENNLAETAFITRLPEDNEADFSIRWFTPTIEVPLCGHATLATAWVLFNKMGWSEDRVRFQSKSGLLGVSRGEIESEVESEIESKSKSEEDVDWLTMDFPNLPFEERPTPAVIKAALSGAPDRAYFVPNDTNYMVEMPDEASVIAADPDSQILKTLGGQGLIITAPGQHCDFVSRYFAPGAGIAEDPVTGSIHSVLVPYWAEKLGKTRFDARQLSRRGGRLRCELKGDRVAIAGQAVLYMEGTVYLP